MSGLDCAPTCGVTFCLYRPLVITSELAQYRRLSISATAANYFLPSIWTTLWIIRITWFANKLLWVLTSWFAAHLVQAAAGTDTAADDDEENGSDAPKTKDHGQWWEMEVMCNTMKNTKGSGISTWWWHNNKTTTITNCKDKDSYFLV